MGDVDLQNNGIKLFLNYAVILQKKSSITQSRAIYSYLVGLYLTSIKLTTLE